MSRRISKSLVEALKADPSAFEGRLIKDVCEEYNVSDKTVRRWFTTYGVEWSTPLQEVKKQMELNPNVDVENITSNWWIQSSINAALAASWIKENLEEARKTPRQELAKRFKISLKYLYALIARAIEQSVRDSILELGDAALEKTNTELACLLDCKCSVIAKVLAALRREGKIGYRRAGQDSPLMAPGASIRRNLDDSTYSEKSEPELSPRLKKVVQKYIEYLRTTTSPVGVKKFFQEQNEFITDEIAHVVNSLPAVHDARRDAYEHIVWKTYCESPVERDDEYFLIVSRVGGLGFSFTGEYWHRYRKILDAKIQRERTGAAMPDWREIFGYDTGGYVGRPKKVKEYVKRAPESINGLFIF